MKRILGFILILSFVFGNVALAKKTPEEARLALGQINIPYTEQAFLKVIRENKDYFAVSYFIDAGMNPNTVLYEHFTPLNTAAFSRNIEATKLLLDLPAIDVNWQDKNGMTALDIATTLAFDDIVDLYNQKGFYSEIKLKHLLSDDEIEEAINLGKTVSSSKKNIIALQAKSFKLQPKGFFTKVELQGKAYWLSPYCTLATHALNLQKKYQKLEELDIKRDTKTYKANIIFNTNMHNIRDLANLRIVAQQGDSIIYPHSVTLHRLADITYSGWTKRGVSASFLASKIDPDKPVAIKIVSAGTSRELIINFNESGSKNAGYIIENSDYLW